MVTHVPYLCSVLIFIQEMAGSCYSVYMKTIVTHSLVLCVPWPCAYLNVQTMGLYDEPTGN